MGLMAIALDLFGHVIQWRRRTRTARPPKSRLLTRIAADVPGHRKGAVGTTPHREIRLACGPGSCTVRQGATWRRFPRRSLRRERGLRAAVGTLERHVPVETSHSAGWR